MAQCERLNVVAVCSCGKVLVVGAPEYKDRDCSWENDFPGVDRSGFLKKNCPCCGGDADIPLGDFYYRKATTSDQHVSM